MTLGQLCVGAATIVQGSDAFLNLVGRFKKMVLARRIAAGGFAPEEVAPVTAEEFAETIGGDGNLRAELEKEIQRLVLWDGLSILDGLGVPSVIGVVLSADPRVLEAYTVLHSSRQQLSKSQRVAHQDQLVSLVADAAKGRAVPADEIARLFVSCRIEGALALRMLGVGLLQGSELLRPDLLMVAISESVSANEQFQALRIVDDRWDDLSRADRGALLTAAQRSSHIPEGSDRARLLARLLDRSARIDQLPADPVAT
jgi:hypothetical protein